MRLRMYAAALGIGLLAVGCGGGSEPATNPPTPRATPQPVANSAVDVVLENFSVTVDPASVPAGKVTFNLDVRGFHSFSVLRTDIAHDKLPVVGEQAVTFDPGRIEVVAADSPSENDRSLEAELKPGSYILICNTEDHYQRGMSTSFEVTS